MTELRSPAGTIYDRGYRHHEGPREGRGRRVRAIAVAGVRRVLGLKRNWKTKVVPWGLLVQGSSDLVRNVAADRGWPLRRLVPRAPSLEETFLRLQAAAQGGPPAPAVREPDAPEAAWGVRR